MKTLGFLILGMFTVGSSSFMMAGLLPQIGQTLSQPISITSQGITAFSLAYLISAPVFSLVFANRSTKRTLQWALILFSMGNLLTVLANSIEWFLLARVITGVGAGIFNPLCVGIALQKANSASKGKILSLVWGANSAGVVFGVPLGIYMASFFPWQFSIGVVLIFGLITLVGCSFQKTSFELPIASSLKSRLQFLADQNIASILLITVLTSVASLGLYSYVSVVHTGSTTALSTALLFWGLGGFCGSSVVGYFVDKTKSPQLVMLYILIGLCVTFVSLPLTQNSAILNLFCFFLWGGFGWATPTPQQHALFDINHSQKSILSALNSSAIGLGSSLGTAIGGLVISTQRTSLPLPFLAALVLVGVILFQFRFLKKSPTWEFNV